MTDLIPNPGFVHPSLPKLLEQLQDISGRLFQDCTSEKPAESLFTDVSELRRVCAEAFGASARSEVLEDGAFEAAHGCLVKLLEEAVSFDAQLCKALLLSFNQRNPYAQAIETETLADACLAGRQVSFRPVLVSDAVPLSAKWALEGVRRSALVKTVICSVGEMRGRVSSAVFALALSQAEAALFRLDLRIAESSSLHDSGGEAKDVLVGLLRLRLGVEAVRGKEGALSKHDRTLWAQVVRSADALMYLSLDGDLRAMRGIAAVVLATLGILELLVKVSQRNRRSKVMAVEEMGYVLLLMEPSFGYRSMPLPATSLPPLRMIEGKGEASEKEAVVRALYERVRSVTQGVIPDGVCGISISPKDGDVIASIGDPNSCDAVVAYVLGATDDSCRQMTFVRSTLPQQTRNALLDALEAIRFSPDSLEPHGQEQAELEVEEDGDGDVLAEVGVVLADVTPRLFIATEETPGVSLALSVGSSPRIDLSMQALVGSSIVFTPQMVAIALTPN